MQGGVGYNVDFGQLVVVAIEFGKRCVVAHVECGEGIVVANERRECQVFANIE